MGLGSMAARVGAMLSPLILALQTTVPWFSQVMTSNVSLHIIKIS